MIYLDYAANTPVSQSVLDTFNEVTLRYIANANSAHHLGELARDRLDESTRQILNLLKLEGCEVIYTSGATEANNLAIKGAAEKYRKTGRHIITTYLEHSSVNGAVSYLQNAGFEVDYLDIKEDGLVDEKHLKELLRKDTILVSICYVDSETGIRQQIGRIGSMLADSPTCRFHVDATQAVGKIPVELENVDLITFAPHKFYGLNGIGVLIKKQEVLLEPQMHGGVSTTPYRSGTPALGLIASAAKALTDALNDQDSKYAYVERLNGRLREALRQYPGVRINSTGQAVSYILNISVPGVKPEFILKELEQREIYLSSKSACCAPNTVSRPVYALTKNRKTALSTLRISLSHLTTMEEIDRFLKAFDGCYQRFAK